MTINLADLAQLDYDQADKRRAEKASKRDLVTNFGLKAAEVGSSMVSPSGGALAQLFARGGSL